MFFHIACNRTLPWLLVRFFGLHYASVSRIARCAMLQNKT